MGNVCGSARAAGDVGAAGVQEAAPAPAPADDIERALAAARAELDAGAAGAALADDYEVGRIIGHGAFAKVQACTHRASGAEFAVKTVPKRSDDLKQREGVVKEVAIMRLLQGHPHTVQLSRVYEDAAAFHLVMELCAGGELFNRIIRAGQFGERDAAAVMRALLSFVQHAHARHVVHRDLKPENILLTSAGPEGQLRVVDFGTSEFCRPGERLTQKFGTPYYVAPEVLQCDYGPAADVWSCGVVLYILLCGYPPFAGASDARILQKVAAGAYSFANREWQCVTEGAKQAVTAMLAVDPRERASAAELLATPWLVDSSGGSPGGSQDGSPGGSPRAAAAAAAPAAPATRRARSSGDGAALGTHMVRRLRAFAAMSHMKRLALVVLARSLTSRDVARLRELFLAMDKDEDGHINAADLHAALTHVGGVLAPGELDELLRLSDVSGRGSIDYEMFLAAMLDSGRVAARRDAVRRSFETLDRDGDGFISVEDLAQVLQDERPAMRGPGGRKLSMEVAHVMVREVDADCDGTVSYEDFRAMWGAATPRGAPSPAPAPAPAAVTAGRRAMAAAAPPPPPGHVARSGYRGFGSFMGEDVEALVRQGPAAYVAPALPFDDPADADGAACPAAEFGAAARRHFAVDFAAWAFVNHGAFGAPAAPARRAADAWRARCEAQPLRFIDRELFPHLVRVIRELAALVNCPPEDLVLLPNATTGLNAVIASTRLGAGDTVFSLDLGYGSVKKMIAAACEAAGARHVEGRVPFPPSGPQAVVDAVAASLPAGARLAVFDAVTSNTALVLPLPELVALCRSRGVPVLVDGAHALGMLPLDLAALGADYFVANCHKWLCGARGSAMLYAAPARQAALRPAVLSHGAGGGLLSRFIWDGCRDYAPLLAASSAVRWWRRLGGGGGGGGGDGGGDAPPLDACCDPGRLAHGGDGGAAARRYMFRLLRDAAALLARRWGTVAPAPRSMTAAMTLVALPAGGPLPPAGSATSDDAKYVQDLLHFRHAVEAPVKCVDGALCVRISAHVYNELADYEALAAAVEAIAAGPAAEEAAHADAGGGGGGGGGA
ncbi:CPK24 [Scenedesmus sp. PABB004]|nr:CPK24 [Scenedesmus sp. PABB004]